MYIVLHGEVFRIHPFSVVITKKRPCYSKKMATSEIVFIILPLESREHFLTNRKIANVYSIYSRN